MVNKVEEIEVCVFCKTETVHDVEYTTMSNGSPWRKGECLKCGHRRTLPKKGVDPNDAELFFGKHKGKKLKDVPTDYLKWMIKNVDLNFSMRNRVKAVLDERSI